MGKYRIASTSELQPGSRRIVQIGRLSIGVFNVNGTYYAIKNRCPHQQAPLCLGKVVGTSLPSKPGEFLYGKEGEVIRCPWHGWEFDLTSGKSLFDPMKCWVKSYEVEVQDNGEQSQIEQLEHPQDEPRLETYPVEVEEETVFVIV